MQGGQPVVTTVVISKHRISVNEQTQYATEPCCNCSQLNNHIPMRSAHSSAGCTDTNTALTRTRVSSMLEAACWLCYSLFGIAADFTCCAAKIPVGRSAMPALPVACNGFQLCFRRFLVGCGTTGTCRNGKDEVRTEVEHAESHPGACSQAPHKRHTSTIQGCCSVLPPKACFRLAP